MTEVKKAKTEKKEKIVKKAVKPVKSEKNEIISDFDPWKVLLYPHLAEKSMNMVEFQNKLTFIVNKKSTKNEIKEAVEKGFNVKVESVNSEITMKGVKKAYIKISAKDSAADVATRLGMI